MTVTDELLEADARYAETLADLEDGVRASRRRILDGPYIPDQHSVRGFVVDVATGRLSEVA
jgi:carbonic anhydrase